MKIDEKEIESQTIRFTEAGMYTVKAILDDQNTTDIPVRVFDAISEYAITGPETCMAGEAFTVAVADILPDSNTGRFIWYQDGVRKYDDKENSHEFVAPQDQSKTVILIETGNGVRKHKEIVIAGNYSAPYLSKTTVAVGEEIEICVDCDGERKINDPETYEEIVINEKYTPYLELNENTIVGKAAGKAVFSVKSKNGRTKYFVVTVTEPDLNHEVKSKVEAKAETCTTPGNKAYYICEKCGQYYDEDGQEITKDKWVIPATGHINSIKIDAKEAGCETCGNIGYYYCEKCGLFFDEQMNQIEENTWILPPKGHIEKIKTEAIEATWTMAGNSEYYTCSICGKSFNDEGQEIETGSWYIPPIGRG